MPVWSTPSATHSELLEPPYTPAPGAEASQATLVNNALTPASRHLESVDDDAHSVVTIESSEVSFVDVEGVALTATTESMSQRDVDELDEAEFDFVDTESETDDGL
jgi:hypothetical protein